jgi:2,3,4,5-tetrahydropyridine-2,6-dicarboxylate N-succinyltransferase
MGTFAQNCHKTTVSYKKPSSHKEKTPAIIPAFFTTTSRTMNKQQQLINDAFEHRHQLSPHTADKSLKTAVHGALTLLDTGKQRVCEKINNTWQVNLWLKKAVLLSFRLFDNQLIAAEYTHFFDKIPQKYEQTTHQACHDASVRIVPPAHVRFGSYIGKNTVLMPSFVNIGAYIDEGAMIDTWATVGSCAQIGKNVHLSGGAGIGGVLEPLQATPTIIEDNCFIGARSEIVEGVIVEQGAVISMGVFIGQSTKIYDRETGEITYGRVPAGAVVVPGSLPGKNGNYHLQCAVIVKRVDEKTRQKTSLNDLLREAQ